MQKRGLKLSPLFMNKILEYEVKKVGLFLANEKEVFDEIAYTS